MELVPMSYRLEAMQAEREQILLGNKKERVIKEGEEGRKEQDELEKEITKGFGIGGIGGAAQGQQEEETRERVFYKLEGLGYRVGQGLVERCEDKTAIQSRQDNDSLQTLERQAAISRHARCDQVPV